MKLRDEISYTFLFCFVREGIFFGFFLWLSVPNTNVNKTLKTNVAVRTCEKKNIKMVRNYKRKTDKPNEEHIKKAIEVVRAGGKVRNTAKYYHIPPQTLRDRLLGRKTKYDVDSLELVSNGSKVVFFALPA